MSLRVGSTMFANEFAGVPEGSTQLKRKSEAPLLAREKVTPSVTEYRLGLSKVVTAWAENVRVVKTKTTHAWVRRGKTKDWSIKDFVDRVGGLSRGAFHELSWGCLSGSAEGIWQIGPKVISVQDDLFPCDFWLTSFS